MTWRCEPVAAQEMAHHYISRLARVAAVTLTRSAAEAHPRLSAYSQAAVAAAVVTDATANVSPLSDGVELGHRRVRHELVVPLLRGHFMRPNADPQIGGGTPHVRPPWPQLGQWQRRRQRCRRRRRPWLSARHEEGAARRPGAATAQGGGLGAAPLTEATTTAPAAAATLRSRRWRGTVAAAGARQPSPGRRGIRGRQRWVAAAAAVAGTRAHTGGSSGGRALQRQRGVAGMDTPHRAPTWQ